jgi:alpha-tubulin suppressor-like RCC1 family protein
VAAIKLDGTLWTWGRNHKGQLGDNSIIDRSSPVTVSGGGTTWKQVSVGSTHTVAIKTDGSLWSCGYNGYGQLADSGSVDKSSFVNIGGVNTWKSVSCTAYTTYAISEASGW